MPRRTSGSSVQPNLPQQTALPSPVGAKQTAQAFNACNNGDGSTRFFQVVYQGSLGVRSTPEKKASPGGQTFECGSIFQSCGLPVAVQEGLLVPVKQPQGGYVFWKQGTTVLLEEVDPLKVEEGEWWYTVVHPGGAYFVKLPKLPPNVTRSNEAVPQNAVVRACRRHTPPGSRMTFVELVDGKGWIVESAQSGTILDPVAEDRAIVKNITGIYRDETEAWYRVVANPGVELLAGPSQNAPTLFEMYLTGKAFCVSQRFRPPGEDTSNSESSNTVYLKIKGRDAWVVPLGSEGERCIQLPHPVNEAVEQWYRVDYPGGIRLRSSPSFEYAHSSLGVFVRGWIFLATRRYRAPGSSDLFLQVATLDGAMRKEVDAAGGDNNAKWTRVVNDDKAECNRGDEACWIPATSDGNQVLTETTKPSIEKGDFAYQVVVDDTLLARDGLHDHSAELEHLPPYSVAKVATVLVGGSREEEFVQLAESGSWVLSRRGQETKMERLPAFPEVDKTPRKFIASAKDGVRAIKGPSVVAPWTGKVLIEGTEGQSVMVWSVKSPKGGEERDTNFVLLQHFGWVLRTHGGSEKDSVLKQLDSPKGGKEKSGKTGKVSPIADPSNVAAIKGL